MKEAGAPAGVLQVNAKVPIGLSPNARQAVLIKVNGAPSQDLLVIRRNHQTGEVSLDPLR